MGLIVEITTKEAFKAISAQRRVFLILLVINVLITTVVALRIAKRTVNPIERLTNKMDEAAKGNLTVGFHGNILTSKNEFGLMARSFNKMLEELKLVVDGMMTSAKNLETSASDLDSVVKDNKEAINQIVEGTASLAETATQDSQDVNMSYQAVGIVAEGADNVAGHILDLNGMLQNSVKVSNKGSEMMDSVTEGINQTFKASQVINKKLLHLNNQQTKSVTLQV